MDKLTNRLKLVVSWIFGITAILLGLMFSIVLEQKTPKVFALLFILFGFYTIPFFGHRLKFKIKPLYHATIYLVLFLLMLFTIKTGTESGEKSDGNGVFNFIIAIGIIGYFLFPRKRKKSLNSNSNKQTRWYWCKECGSKLESKSKPKNTGCQVKLAHHWVDLGQSGANIYQCSNCNLKVNTIKQPTKTWCPNGLGHDWEKLN